MGEPYRTSLGHFRHEVGHHFWDILVRNRNKVEACRAVFGDHSVDYAEALKRHYEHGSPPDWQEYFVSKGGLNNQVQHLSGRVLRWEPTTSI